MHFYNVVQDQAMGLCLHFNEVCFYSNLAVPVACFFVDQDDLKHLNSLLLFSVLVRKASLCVRRYVSKACVFAMEHATLQ